MGSLNLARPQENIDKDKWSGPCSVMIMIGLKCSSMKNASVLMLFSVFGILVLLVMLGGSQFGSGDTLYVDDDGGVDYTTINHAMENATDGDTIMIHPGSYEEELVVTKEVTITSTTGNPEDVVVYKGGGYSIFWIQRNNVTISDLTIRYAWYTVFIDTVDGCIIEDNIIMGSQVTGVLIDGNYQNGASNNTIRGNNITMAQQKGAQIGSEGGYNVIENNMFYECGDGLWLYFTGFETVRNNTIMGSDGTGLTIHQSNYCTITNNTVTGNTRYGFSMSYSSYNTLRGNTISGSEYNIDFLGTTIPDFEHDIDDSNTVDGRPIYFWVDEDNATVPTDAGFVGMVKSENITVKDLTLEHNGESVLFVSTEHSLIKNVDVSFSNYGIHLFFSDHNTLDGVTAWQSDDAGIYLKESHSNVLTGCNASDGGYNSADGIEISNSDHVTIITCQANDNWGKGIMLSSANYCLIFMNEVQRNRASGIWLVTGIFNRIENNTASDNDDNGIYLGSDSKWNHVANNTCSRNGATMNDGGLNLYGGSGNTAIHNTVSYNRASGFYINYGSGNLITENDVQFNTGRAGFYMMKNAEANTITHNNVSNNLKGFELSMASGNFIENNTIFNSDQNGIYIYDGDQNTIISNYIVNTSENYGIHLKSSCQDNLIYDNYLDNEQNAFDDGTNFWNTSKRSGTTIVDGPFLGGNFWDNYTGFDADSDWLGDTPLMIDGGENEDLMPLMLKPAIRPDFTWDPKNPLENEEVMFTDLTRAGDYPLTNWHWDFDDGTTSDEQDPAHTFASAGTYEVELDVRDENGDSKKATKLVFVKLSGPLLAENVDTGKRFPSIQKAINDIDTLDGHTIVVEPGTYTDVISVEKQLTIRSASGNPADTIIQGGLSNYPVFTITADHVEISGLTITGAWVGGGVGLYMNHSDHSNIHDNIIRENGGGITLLSCENSTIANNTIIMNSWAGISISSWIMAGDISANNIIRDNEIIGFNEETDGYGMYMTHVSGNSIIGNIIRDYKIGIWLMENCNENDISNNEISNNSDKGIAVGVYYQDFETLANSDNVFNYNTLWDNANYDFYSENSSRNSSVEFLTLDYHYPTTISFRHGEGIGIKGLDFPIGSLHPQKEILGLFVNIQVLHDDAWVSLKIHYDDDAVGHLNESSIEINGYWVPHTPTPWYDLNEDNGINMNENFAWVNFSWFSDVHQEMFWLYGVVGGGKYDLDFGDAGFADIRFATNGNLDITIESALNPDPGDDDSIGIFINVTLEGTGALEWLNITIDVSENSFVGEDDDVLIYYWNETGDEWVLCDNTGWNPDTKTVWANLTHLTIFAPRKTAEGPENPDQPGDEEGDGIPVAIIAGAAAVILILVLLILAQGGFMPGMKRPDEGDKKPSLREEIEALSRKPPQTRSTDGEGSPADRDDIGETGEDPTNVREGSDPGERNRSGKN